MGCQSDADCGPGARCDVGRGLCEAAPVEICATHADCGDGSVCVPTVVEAEGGGDPRLELLCQPEAAGGGGVGEPCQGRDPEECWARLCLVDVQECSGVCGGEEQCPDSHHCSLVSLFKEMPALRGSLIPACSPGPRCVSPADCPDGLSCSAADLVGPRGAPDAELRATPFCRAPTEEGAGLGEACAVDADCGSGLCGPTATCGEFCRSHVDCGGRAICFVAPYALALDDDLEVPVDGQVCYPRCNRRADCPGELVCAGQLHEASLLAFCIFSDPDGAPVGAACRADEDCLTGWCFSEPGVGRYCTEFCDERGDCAAGMGCYEFQDMGGAYTWSQCSPDA